MSDFQVGDVVVCVDASPRDHCEERHLMAAAMLARGTVYRVISMGTLGVTDLGRVCHPFGGWATDRFRKLPKAEDEFTALIRQCKPTKVQA